jgi:hypothetical protein
LSSIGRTTSTKERLFADVFVKDEGYKTIVPRRSATSSAAGSEPSKACALLRIG